MISTASLGQGGSGDDSIKYACLNFSQVYGKSMINAIFSKFFQKILKKLDKNSKKIDKKIPDF